MHGHERFNATTEQVLRAHVGFVGRCGIKRGLTCSRCAKRHRRIKRATARARRREGRAVAEDSAR